MEVEHVSSSLDEITFIRAVHSDAARCNAFHNRIYQTDRPLKGWHWEFSQNIEKGSPLNFILIERAQKVVGTQAYIQIDMIDKDGLISTGKSEETLVDPSIRGKQMFERLYEYLFEVAHLNGVMGLWGFTPAGKAFRKVGFDTPASVSQLLKPLSTNFISRVRPPYVQNELSVPPLRWKILGTLAFGISCLRWPLKNKTGITLNEIFEAPDWVDEISKNFIAQWGGVSIHRSRKFCDWRFFSNPFAICRFWAVYQDETPVGYVVTTMHDGILFLVDVILISKAQDGTNEKASSRLLRNVLMSVEDIAKSSKASGIRTWHGSNHPFALLILKAAKRLGWFHYRRGSEIVLWRNKEAAANRLPKDPNQYYITRAFTEGHMG
jgi:N-acetylglutamate synthase-like GNAT family acetyltransferase